MINHCDLCKKVIWGKAWLVKLYDRENRRTLCPECCEMLEMFNRVEEKEEMGKREEGRGIRD